MVVPEKEAVRWVFANYLIVISYGQTCRIVNIWNSLPTEVVNAPSLNSFKNRLDRFWMNQDILYNWHAELTRTGSRSIVSC